MIMGLAFLPKEAVASGFEWLGGMATSPEAERLMTYYENAWLGLWKPKDFSVYSRQIRTNNDLEGL